MIFSFRSFSRSALARCSAVCAFLNDGQFLHPSAWQDKKKKKPYEEERTSRAGAGAVSCVDGRRALSSSSEISADLLWVRGGSGRWRCLDDGPPRLLLLLRLRLRVAERRSLPCRSSDGLRLMSSRAVFLRLGLRLRLGERERDEERALLDRRWLRRRGGDLERLSESEYLRLLAAGERDRLTSDPRGLSGDEVFLRRLFLRDIPLVPRSLDLERFRLSRYRGGDLRDGPLRRGGVLESRLLLPLREADRDRERDSESREPAEGERVGERPRRPPRRSGGTYRSRSPRYEPRRGGEEDRSRPRPYPRLRSSKARSPPRRPPRQLSPPRPPRKPRSRRSRSRMSASSRSRRSWFSRRMRASSAAFSASIFS